MSFICEVGLRSKKGTAGFCGDCGFLVGTAGSSWGLRGPRGDCGFLVGTAGPDPWGLGGEASGLRGGRGGGSPPGEGIAPFF